MLSEMGSILFVLVIGIRMLGQSSVLGVAQYHESRLPCFLDWGYQMLFHPGSVLLFGIVVSFG